MQLGFNMVTRLGLRIIAEYQTDRRLSRFAARRVRCPKGINPDKCLTVVASGLARSSSGHDHGCQCSEKDKLQNEARQDG
jgi:hypothetical protein